MVHRRRTYPRKHQASRSVVRRNTATIKSTAHPGLETLSHLQPANTDAKALARALYDTLSTTLQDPHPFTHVIFCTNTTFKDAGFRPDLVSVNTNASDVEALTVQKEFGRTWQAIDQSANVSIVRTIEEAVAQVRSGAGGEPTTAFVTGSLHLVGGFLEVIESAPQ